MKKYATLFLLAGLLSACMSDTTEPAPEASTFHLSKERMQLNAGNPADSSHAFLSCGCRFTLNVESFTGDTNVIHYSQRDASTTATRVGIYANGDLNAEPGNYAARLAVLSTGSKGTFRDTIYIEYTR
ncbi:MAG TPA: hypothetical protein VFH43_12240 [Candidatus Kapabacteria bacterium]|nr:hypothetical protein [Candidatus Kapabacteria bacterium]